MIFYYIRSKELITTHRQTEKSWFEVTINFLLSYFSFNYLYFHGRSMSESLNSDSVSESLDSDSVSEYSES
ncbi:hypothetical protein Glove_199g95 [Diversispora epigaea]|uniref:Uncharacterized protein n=1 Tax=Diversispora epigaea TaxID=1348612 RepID=A0A397IUB4_9GLOM|nr:hypothetical protein Glove_199g95 [Diversispora epigaea]